MTDSVDEPKNGDFELNLAEIDLVSKYRTFKSGVRGPEFNT